MGAKDTFMVKRTPSPAGEIEGRDQSICMVGIGVLDDREIWQNVEMWQHRYYLME